MFVKIQDENDLINLDCVAEIRIREESGEYIIEAICKSSVHITLASFMDEGDAECCFKNFCYTLKDNEGYFEFWHDKFWHDKENLD